MKNPVIFAIGLVWGALVCVGADVRISDLPLSTAPSTNTFIEIADMNAATKSAKYLLTNLATVTYVNSHSSTNTANWVASGTTNSTLAGTATEYKFVTGITNAGATNLGIGSIIYGKTNQTTGNIGAAALTVFKGDQSISALDLVHGETDASLSAYRRLLRWYVSSTDQPAGYIDAQGNIRNRTQMILSGVWNGGSEQNGDYMIASPDAGAYEQSSPFLGIWMDAIGAAAVFRSAQNATNNRSIDFKDFDSTNWMSIGQKGELFYGPGRYFTNHDTRILWTAPKTMTIDGNGSGVAKLGINTSVASEALQVVGNASVTGTNFVSELISSNGITLGGVRNTVWPAGGSTNMMVSTLSCAGTILSPTFAVGGLSTTAASCRRLTMRCTLTNSIVNVTNVTGTLIDGDTMVWELLQDGTGGYSLPAVGAAWDTQYMFGTDITGLTVTTNANKRDFVTWVYNSTASKFYCVGFVRGY